MQVVILAGGKGTRLGELTRSVPKPMARLAGKPMVEHQIELARRHGCTNLILLTGHLGQTIEDYFHDGSGWGVSIRYHRETTPRGTAGALKEVESWLDDDFLVFYGDTVMDVDLHALTRFHAERRPMATLVVHPNSHPYDSDLLELGADQRIVAFHAKPRSHGRPYGNCANAALYVISRGLLRHIRTGQCADLGKDVFPRALEAGETLWGYRSAEYIKDIGTPERFREVDCDVLSGKVARLNRTNPRAAVFLDRDGVLNVERDHVLSAGGLQLLPGAAEAIRKINRSEHLAVLVTNQPAVAKGWLSEAELRRIHDKLETMLGAEHAYLDRIYYCPHHPDKGFEGETAEYKIACQCRKPAPGMILAAKAELNVDLAHSWMIGDRTADIAAGARAGCRTIVLRTGYGGRDGKCLAHPDFVCNDLAEAVGFLLGTDSGATHNPRTEGLSTPSLCHKKAG